MRSLRAALLVCLAGTWVACSQPRAELRTRSGVPTVAVAAVGRGDIAQRLTVAGEFRPFQEVDLHAKVAGYVDSILVDVGDRVRAGQLLAVLDVPELHNQLQQDAAEVARAEQDVNRAQADLRRAESAHEIAHVAALRLAAVGHANARLISQQDLDTAAGRDRVAEAQVSIARAALSVARGQLEMAQAARSGTVTLIGYSRITAPFAGVITHRYANTGSMIQAGTSSHTQTMPVVRVSENTRLRLVIPAPETAVARIHRGMPVDLRVVHRDRRLRGAVARVADRLDLDTRTMRVEVDVPNPDLALVPGMYAEATMMLDRVRDVVVSPIQAIDQTAGGARAFVVTADHRLERRTVVLGLQSADTVEIRSGLRPGEWVVVGSRGQLRVGSRVNPRVRPASGQETR